MEDDFRRFVTSFGSLLNAEKRYHKKSHIFPDLMVRVLDRLGAGGEEKRLAVYTSLIYDLGLMVIDERILVKEKLIQSDVRILKSHPQTTIGLLENFEFSEDVKKAILHHHEMYDGTGYPDQLEGEGIPFISRVLSVVDAYLSMITERPYRKAFTEEEALREIKKGCGSIYDPKVIEAFEGVLESRRENSFLSESRKDQSEAITERHSTPIPP